MRPLTVILQAGILAIVCSAYVVGSPVRESNQKQTVDVGDLNKKALKIPLIAYPPAARSAGAHGIVKVRVWINQKGDVIRTSIVSGHRLLRTVALRSARGSKFSPNLGDCESCRQFTGVLTYTFVKQDLPRREP